MSNEVFVRKVAALTGHSGSVYALEDAGAGSFFSGGSDKILALWDIAVPGEGQMVANIPQIIYSIARLPQQNKLLVGQATGGIHLINLENKKEERLLQFHNAPIFDITFSEKNNLLFTLSGDGELGVIDMPSFNLKSKIKLSSGKLRNAALNAEESMIAVGSADGSIYVFSIPEMQPVKHWQAHQEGFSVNALEFSPDGNILLSGSRDAHMNVYDVKADFLEIKSIPAHNYAIYSISYSPDRKLLATGSRDKTIKIWNPETFEVLVRIDKESHQSHVNSVNKLIWHSETGHLISGGDDRSVLVWEINRNA